MGKRQDSWRRTFVALGEAMIEVLRAELAVISEAWRRSGRELGIALGMLAVAAYVALVCLPALFILAMVAGLHAAGLPVWGAALVVAAVVALAVWLVVKLAFRRLARRCENPVATVKTRFSDHVAWWHEKILRDDRTLGEGDEDDDAGERSAD